MFGWNSIVDILVLQQLVRCFNQEELQDAFDNDLIEDPTLFDIRKGRWEGRGVGRLFKRGRSDEFLKGGG